MAVVGCVLLAVVGMQCVGCIMMIPSSLFALRTFQPLFPHAWQVGIVYCIDHVVVVFS
jgi:hypothetical protein